MSRICVNPDCDDHGVARPPESGNCPRCNAPLEDFEAAGPEEPEGPDPDDRVYLDFVEVHRFSHPAERPAIEALLSANGIRYIVVDSGRLGLLPMTFLSPRRPSIVRVEPDRADEARALLQAAPTGIDEDREPG